VASGAVFRSRLTPSDVNRIALARNLFHLTAILPPCLYYFSRFGVDNPPKFPATISYTIRAGLPKWLHHLIWSSGWFAMYGLFHRYGDTRLRVFALQMFCTGVVTTAVCSLGKSKLHDQIHSLGACLYMLDHHVLFRILDSKTSYMRVFYSAFVVMVSTMAVAKRKYHWEESAGNKVPSSLWWLELAIMGSENLLFSSFVSSMCSGLHNTSHVSSFQRPPRSNSSLLQHLLDSHAPVLIGAFMLFSLVKTVSHSKTTHSHRD